MLIRALSISVKTLKNKSEGTMEQTDIPELDEYPEDRKEKENNTANLKANNISANDLARLSVYYKEKLNEIIREVRQLLSDQD